MNDFTKDELETIALWFNDIPQREEWPDNCDRTRYYRSLANKIQSMIDNYCEHDEGFTQDSMMVSICNKCGAC